MRSDIDTDKWGGGGGGGTRFAKNPKKTIWSLG
jgi:hypothetical protein